MCVHLRVVIVLRVSALVAVLAIALALVLVLVLVLPLLGNERTVDCLLALSYLGSSLVARNMKKKKKYWKTIQKNLE